MRRELARRHPADPHLWALAYRQIRGKPLLDIPAVAGILRDPHPRIVIQKSAQAGISEALVNLGLWAADTQVAGRGHVLYVLPTQSQAEDFVQTRVDTAFHESAYLRSRMQPEPPTIRRKPDNLRVKRLGLGYVYFRSSESARQLTSIDADRVILDEYDFMPETAFGLAERRLSSSADGRLIMASTPRHPEAGINAQYLRSDRRRYYLTCRACGLSQPLDWPDNVDQDNARVVCRKCRARIDVLSPGEWVAEAPGNAAVHGYHLNRLYSPFANIRELIDASDGYSIAATERFQNDDLGLPYVPPGGGVTPDDLDRCRADYDMGDYGGERTVMGVDVGDPHLHVVIREVPVLGQVGPRFSRLRFADVVSSFDELTALTSRFNVQGMVIDEQPERRLARQFVREHFGGLARYVESGDLEWVRDERVWRIPRTEWLDELFSRVRAGTLTLPKQARELGGRVRDGMGEYYREMLAPQRMYERDRHGNPVARWREGARADHFAHAEIYCLVAAGSELIRQRNTGMMQAANGYGPAPTIERRIHEAIYGPRQGVTYSGPVLPSDRPVERELPRMPDFDKGEW